MMALIHHPHAELHSNLRACFRLLCLNVLLRQLQRPQYLRQLRVPEVRGIHRHPCNGAEQKKRSCRPVYTPTV